MNIRAILLDFDGTSLLRDQIYMSFRTKHALLEAIRRGIEIIPCTGRCEDMFPPQVEAEKRIHYWVTANGGRVVDRLNGEIIYQSLFTPEESAIVCRIFEGQQIYSEISANGLIYMEQDVCDHLEKYAVPPHHIWFLELKRQKALNVPSQFFLDNGVGIEKVNLYGATPEQERSIVGQLNDTGFVTVGTGTLGDIQFFPKRQERANAMEALFQKLGVGQTEVVCMDTGSGSSDDRKGRHWRSHGERFRKDPGLRGLCYRSLL